VDVGDLLIENALGGPLAELNCPSGIDVKSDGDDGVEIIMINTSGYFACSFNLNYPEFPDSCLTVLLSCFVKISQMLIYCSDINIEEGRS